VDAAALMAGSLEGAAQRCNQASVLVGDDELHPGKLAESHRLEEPAPEHLVPAVADVGVDDFALPGGGDAGSDHDGHRGDLAGVVADVQVRGVQVDVGELGVAEAAGAERSDVLAEAGADP
jgi:hypothetical protein